MLFTSTFGRAEKESAAEIIYDKSIDSGTRDIYLTFSDFPDDEIGFGCLMIEGYINESYPLSCGFRPNKKFWEVIDAKLATLSEEDIKNKIGCRCGTCVAWGIVPGTEEYNKRHAVQSTATIETKLDEVSG